MVNEILPKRCNRPYQDRINSTREETRKNPITYCTRENLRLQILHLYGEDIHQLSRLYEKLQTRRTRLLCDLNFLRRCRDHKIVPTCFKLKFHKDTTAVKNILRRSSFALIRNAIHTTRTELDNTNKELHKVHLQLGSTLHPLLWDRIQELAHFRAETNNKLKTEKQNEKFLRLAEKQNQTPSKLQDKPYLENVVHNISSRQLTPAETSVLAKGFNFALAPHKVPIENIICSVETALTNTDHDTADIIRQEVTNVLRQAKPPKSNISREENLALRNLAKDQTITILPADKGNATVVMDREEYNKKMEDLLQNSAYQPINSDPTTYLEKTTKIKIKASPIDKEVQKQIIPREKSSKCPKLYGLPKIHKEGTPLRPIVSSIGSPLQNLARYLSQQLQPHAENIASYVKNSQHFVEIIKGLHVNENDLLVSFDVVSLFTQIPVQEALDIIKSRYDPPLYIMELLEHCLHNTYFIYNQQRYKQVEGAPMGSPLSPVIANLFMEDFELKALETSPEKPKLWLRYVDDTFVIWQHGREKLDKFLKHLNNIHPKIKFTMETEEQLQLPFLDVLVYKKPNNTLGHTIYQKKTHTNRYLHGNSHHHPAQLNSVARTLITRVNRLADDDHTEHEMSKLRKVLLQNQFQQTTVNTIIQQTLQNTSTQKTREDEHWPKTFLPYVKGTTDKIARILRRHQVKTVFTTDRKIGSILPTPKDKINLEDQGVYEIPCNVCQSSYVGQTNRRIQVRKAEHINAVAKKEKTSSLYQHQATTGHDINFEGTRILAKIENLNYRVIREAIEIEKRPNNLNKRDDSTRLPDTWRIALTDRRINRATTYAIPEQSQNAPPPADDVSTQPTNKRTTRATRSIQIQSERRVTRSQTKSNEVNASPEDGK